jgi:hypothetical protein
LKGFEIQEHGDLKDSVIYRDRPAIAKDSFTNETSSSGEPQEGERPLMKAMKKPGLANQGEERWKWKRSKGFKRQEHGDLKDSVI